MEELAKLGDKRALSVLKCIHDLGLTLSSTQLGITLASLGLGWIGENAFSQVLGNISPTIFFERDIGRHFVATTLSFMTITLIHVVLGELVPKSIAIESPERLALLLARPLRAFYFLSRPFVALFTGLASFCLATLGYTKAKQVPISEQELKLIVSGSQKDGVLSTGEAFIISRALSFADKTAIDVMIPKDKVGFLSLEKTIQENLAAITDKNYTRFPLCRGDLNHVIGIVHTKDVWPYLLTDLSNQQLEKRCRSPVFVSQHMRRDHLMQFFQMRQAHLAIVRNNSGKNIGIVTLQDLMEQLIGYFPH